MWVFKWTVGVVLVLVVGALIAGQLGLLRGRAPADLGVQQGKLKALSHTDNSVSSQADLYPNHPQRKYACIAPLTLRGDGPSTMAKLKRVLEGTDGAKITTSDLGGPVDTHHFTFHSHNVRLSCHHGLPNALRG